MARNPVNPDIGEITCAFTGEKGCPVRRDRNGKFYYVSGAGMIKPNMAAGQAWMMDNATLYGPTGKPTPAPSEPVNGSAPAAKPEKPVNEQQPPASKKSWLDTLIG